MRITWDVAVTGGWIDWFGKRTLNNDLRLAVGALILAFICIIVHTRSMLLGLLGAAQVAMSFPLALWVYKVRVECRVAVAFARATRSYATTLGHRCCPHVHAASMSFAANDNFLTMTVLCYRCSLALSSLASST